ncbi:hypothetical protein [Paraburkholderia caribensis]|uniref:hypothetical protein n=1 Tax=Paraburkholderia caribensis TaxID=75105 RepID=UPI001591B42B|nr:hypothetical protein [Paraburkholderia caribensis]
MKTAKTSNLGHSKGPLLVLTYVDVMDGDLVAGLILSQICYWALPNPKTGKSKLTIGRNGKLWLAKTRAQWWDECRVDSKTAKRKLEKIAIKGIVELAVFKFGGPPTTHVWLNVARLDELLHGPKCTESPCPNGQDGKMKMDNLSKSLDNTLNTYIEYNKKAFASYNDAEEKTENALNPISEKIKNRKFEKPNLENTEEENGKIFTDQNLSPKPKANSATDVTAALNADKSVAPTNDLKGKSGMLMLWKERMSVLYESGWKEPTAKEAGQLGQLFTKLVGAGHDPIKALDFGLQRWSQFAFNTRCDKSLDSVPSRPVIGFLLAHYDSLLQLIAKQNSQKNQMSVGLQNQASPSLGSKPKTTFISGQPLSAHIETARGEKPSVEYMKDSLDDFYRSIGFHAASN